jgi:hypothetical protein
MLSTAARSELTRSFGSLGCYNDHNCQTILGAMGRWGGLAGGGALGAGDGGGEGRRQGGDIG